MRNDRKFEKEVSEYKERLVYINRVPRSSRAVRTSGSPH